MGLDLTQINDHFAYEVLGDRNITGEKINNNTIRISNNDHIERSYDMRMVYAGVNSELEYQISPRLSVATGLGISELMSSKLIEEGSQSSHSFPLQNGLNSKIHVGIAYKVPFSKGWNLELQPNFNYYMGSVVGSEFNTKPYNVGLRLNLLRK